MSAGPARPSGARSVAVIGAGASGSLLAAQLLRRAAPGTRVMLIERSGRFGPGVAYGAGSDAHRLNVGAVQMSPLPKDPEAFFRWARERGLAAGPYEYLPRRLFGEYLGDLLDRCERRAAGIVELERCADEVVAVLPGAGGLSRQRITLRSGRSVEVDDVLLALGNSTPPPPPGIPRGVLESPFYQADPWAPGALAQARSDEAVLLVGTGLTMVDVALELGVGGGPVIHAVSRSGLMPRAHLARPPRPLPPPLDRAAKPSLDQLVAALTAAAVAAAGRGEDWRAVIDSMRPLSNDIWNGLGADEQERFRDDFARIWSIHRHRMAPQVGEAIARLAEKGRLRVRAASVRTARVRDGAVDVDLLGARPPAELRLRVDRIVNCTGPAHDPDHIAAPLVRDLVRGGWVRSNRLGTGFDTAADGTVLNRGGRPVAGLYAIGPLRDGGLFETSAVPEIALQAREIAIEITGNADLRPSCPRSPALRAGA